MDCKSCLVDVAPHSLLLFKIAMNKEFIMICLPVKIMNFQAMLSSQMVYDNANLNMQIRI